jgi:hypothetical protein
VGEKTGTQLGPLERANLNHWTRTETSCSPEYQMMEKVQKPSNSLCYTPSSEPFRIYPQSMFIPLCGRQSFTPIQNYRQNYTFVYCNFYGSRQHIGRQKVLDWMVASITWINMISLVRLGTLGCIWYWTNVLNILTFQLTKDVVWRATQIHNEYNMIQWLFLTQKAFWKNSHIQWRDIMSGH